jgi:ankyrin repeat protein
MSDINGNLPIHLAMQIGHNIHWENFGRQDENVAIVEHLLRMYPESASKSNAKGECPLHFAIRYHSLALINRLLISHPTSASMTNSRGYNILHLAVARSDYDAETVTYICTQYPNLIHGVSKCGYTPLHYALSIWNLKGASAICKVYAQIV